MNTITTAILKLQRDASVLNIEMSQMIVPASLFSSLAIELQRMNPESFVRSGDLLRVGNTLIVQRQCEGCCAHPK